MCGISGIWGKNEEKNVKGMMRRMVHRGPDAEGMHVCDQGVLGHRRLSIMDPRGGNQPIYNEDRSKAVIANGEIYNFPKLRSQLEGVHTFATRSDTEAIVHLFEDVGSGVAERLDGMFAFAVADGDDIMIARDPIGIKSLYYGRCGEKFMFASELKALAPYCENIEEFPPGAVYHSREGLKTFYTVPDLWPEDRPADELIAEIRKTLEESVVKRLMSDVPLGAFLSGGLDSSIICAIARKHLPELHTFSVGVEGSRDLRSARMLSEYLDTVHHEYILTEEEIKEKLPHIIYHLESFDQDLVRSAFPCYFTSKIAAEEVKVILTGEGADELFAGYTYYKGIPDEHVLHEELRRSVASLHNINLQRVDRMTMAHSIEGRVPFLDLRMIELGQKVPARYKLVGEPPVEKWILRKAFEDLLPEEIVWRKKEQFDEGSGSAELLEETLSKMMTEEEAEAYRLKFPETSLRSPEECHYHKLFMEVFENPEAVLRNVGRWAERPPEVSCSA
ncbi:MAG: asparagine synthase B [Nitrospirota bacterium]|jgi:asparagine synthase (glutamine-hydrolysing)